MFTKNHESRLVGSISSTKALSLMIHTTWS